MYMLRLLISKICPPPFYNIVRGWVFDENQIIYNEISYREYAETAITNFRPNIDKRERKHLLKEMKKAFLSDEFRPDEYLLYNFDKKDSKSRGKYISQRLKEELIYQYYMPNSGKISVQLKNKYLFYILAKPFFKRDVIRIERDDDWYDFKNFCTDHTRFICKAIDKGCGVGIKIYEINEFLQLEELFKDLIQNGAWVLEEIINQNDKLAAFNASSLNTVRLPSFRHDDTVVQNYPCIRFGRRGSIVDNAGKGGLFASIDIKTGKIMTNGFDELGREYEEHPDSKVKFMGYQIPQWTSLLEEAKQAHLSLPANHVYVAFDYALSEQGWSIVEGNWGDFIMQQTSLKKGLKKDFISLLKG